MKIWITLFWSILLATVTSCATQPDANEMNRLASALTKLTAAVDAAVRYDGIRPNTPSPSILSQSTTADPQLLKPFEGYSIQVVQQGENSLVLVCDAEKKTALLEDAGCTARMDLHRWNSPTRSSCQPTLNLMALCIQP